MGMTPKFGNQMDCPKSENKAMGLGSKNKLVIMSAYFLKMLADSTSAGTLRREDIAKVFERYNWNLS
jgi:hypothetical protein